jgi:chromosome segregation ATPase
MKNNTLMLVTWTSLTALGLVTGCGPVPDSPPAPEAVRDVPTQGTQQVDRAYQNQVQTVTTSVVQRTEFVSQLRQDLTRLNAEIDTLATRAAASGDAIKTEFEAKLSEARAKVSRIGERLEQVPGATESSWLEVRESLGNAYDEAKESVNQARTWLSEKIKP